jgi:hypothetical protein
MTDDLGRAATRDSWKILPYDGPFRSFPSAEVFTADECQQLRQGLVPEVMEDKWFVFFEDPFVYLYRSWTSELAYRLRLTADGRGGRIGEALASRHVGTTDAPEYESALVSFLLRGLVLRQDVPFPVPSSGAPGPPGLFQHAFSGTAAPEEPRRAPGDTAIRSAIVRAWRRLTGRRA